MEAMKIFFADYTSYVIIGTSLLTCYDFFKSRSRILVFTVVAIILLLAVVFHNPLLNCLSGTTEMIGIYHHSIVPGTKRINWKKLSIILGTPLAVLLISHLLSLSGKVSTLWPVVFTLLVWMLAVNIGLGVIGGFVCVQSALQSPTKRYELGDYDGCFVTLIPLGANMGIFGILMWNNAINQYYASSDGVMLFIVVFGFFIAWWCVALMMSMIPIYTCSAHPWASRAIVVLP